MPPGVLETLHHPIARLMAAFETRGEHATERGVALQGLDDLARHLIGLHHLPDLVEQAGRQHAIGLQRPQPLDGDRHGDHGAEQDRPHHRAASPHYFPHRRVISHQKA